MKYMIVRRGADLNGFDVIAMFDSTVENVVERWQNAGLELPPNNEFDVYECSDEPVRQVRVTQIIEDIPEPILIE